jgi:hypothetical protein
MTTKPPLFLTIERDEARAIITASGPQYIANSRAVKVADVESVVECIKLNLPDREVIVKEFVQ